MRFKRLIKSIPLKKLKRNLKIILIGLGILLLLGYFIQKTSFHYLLYKLSGYKSYDLMSDALIQQNVKKIQLNCNRSEEEYLKSNYGLHKNYYNPFGSPQQSHPQWYDLFYESTYDLTKLPANIKYLLKQLKLCSSGEFRVRFRSRHVNNISTERFLLRRKHLKASEFDEVRSNPNLKLGGYFRSAICLQELLYYYSNINGLDLIQNLVSSFNPNTTSRRELLETITKTTYPIIRDLVSSDAKRLKSFLSKKTAVTVIIVPYMNRKKNLVDFLYNMHWFLQRQFISYVIVVAEQFNSEEPFNKGRLYNRAYIYVKHKLFSFTRVKIGCIILHDVDLIPESDLNVYQCGENDDSPRHLSVAIRSHTSEDDLDLPELKKELSESELMAQYKTYYDFLIGGVLCIKPDTYELINGFSNEYFNWGGEDDDIAMRMNAKNVCINRPPSYFSAYKMSQHQKSKTNPIRESLLFSSVKRMNRDGLSNIMETTSIIDRISYGLYTKLLINVGKKSLWSQIKDNVF